MLEVRRTGPSLQDAARGMQDVPSRVLPYATATALTKSAKRGQKAIIARLSVDFQNPVAYTLNATRIEVASKDHLFARIAVKDQGTGGGRPTSYLLPEVEGGTRGEKGMERALRFAGILMSGERAMPGAGVMRDSFGNVPAATVRTILRSVSRPGAAQKRTASGGIFAGAVGRKQTRGIWQRDGKKIRPLFVFTKNLPTYRPRLDFVGAAATAVRDGLASDFYAAAQSLTRKFGA